MPVTFHVHTLSDNLYITSITYHSMCTLCLTACSQYIFNIIFFSIFLSFYTVAILYIMAFQSALLRLLGICTLIVVIATIIIADDADSQEIMDLSDDVEIEKREIAQDFLDFLRTRKLDNRGRQRVS